MLIFLSIAIASFIMLAGSFFFGHDHDTDHTDAGHPGDGHDFAHDMEPTIGFFSIKVLATLTMGFGAAGAIARTYGADYLTASLVGLGTGIMLSLVMYFLLRLIYSQQSSSLIQTSSVIGASGIVTTSIGSHGLGEVGLTFGGQYITYIARSSTGDPVERGTTVRVVNVVGSEIIVEPVRS